MTPVRAGRHNASMVVMVAHPPRKREVFRFDSEWGLQNAVRAGMVTHCFGRELGSVPSGSIEIFHDKSLALRGIILWRA